MQNTRAKSFRFRDDIRSAVYAGREAGFQQNLAKRLWTDGMCSSIGKGGGVRPSVDVVGMFREKNNRKAQQESAIERMYVNTEVPLIDLTAAMRKVAKDASIKALAQLLSRTATDEVAKAYWRDYFGEYGVQMTRDVREMRKSSGVKVGVLLKHKEWLERNYGRKAAAVVAINEAIGAVKLSGKIQDTIEYVIDELGEDAPLETIAQFVNDLTTISVAVKNQVIQFFRQRANNTGYTYSRVCSAGSTRRR